MKIRNFKSLFSSRDRYVLLSILEAGLQAIDIKRIVRENIKLDGQKLNLRGLDVSLKNIKNIYLVGIGKSAFEVASELKKIFKEFKPEGIVLDEKIGRKKIPGIKCFAGTHPLPSTKNQKITAKILKLLKRAGAKDIVFFIISGGGTALLSQPKSITPKQEAGIVKCLFEKGANIRQMNILRKHLSFARGGHLARAAYPAKSISLIFSDVPGNDLQFVASGPTVKDKTSLKEAESIIKKFGLEECAGLNIKKALIETPKENKYFKKVKNILFASNESALRAMAAKAKSFGFHAEIMTAKLRGEARKAALRILKALSLQKSGTLLLYGGETTVKTRGRGRGGRNQELVLSALLGIKPDQIIVACASDGKDNTPYAGAIADRITLMNTRSKGLDPKIYLDNNDSYNFFRKSGDFIKTGPTGSNVADLILAAKFKK